MTEFAIDFPTLGDLGEKWITRHCRVPDGFTRGKPFNLADWQFWCHANRYRIREGAEFVPPERVGPDEPAVMNQAFFYRMTLIVAPQKALALDTPIATPGGWTTMGAVAIGDEIFDEAGNPTRVTSKSPVWESDTYRVTFSDGASLVACKDHQWWVERRTSSGTYVPDRVRTKDLVGNLTDPNGARIFRVPNAGPLNLPDADLPVDPYTLGAWLGDGHSDDGRLTGIDRPIFDRIASAGHEVRQMKIAKRINVIGMKLKLRALGVLRNKHVPSAYLRASETQRWELLQGLMDTDGYADARQGKCEFTTTLPALRDSVMELLASLGVKPLCIEGLATLDGRVTGPKWRIGFAARDDMPVFGLARKQDRLKAAGTSHAQFKHRRIVAVELIETVPTQCLTVEAASHVFLAGREMIPTCNTGKGPFSASQVAFEACGPSVFAGWAEGGEVYSCADNGCPCGWEDSDERYVFQPGEPMGMRHPSPLIQITANSEDQAANIYRPLRAMIKLGPLKYLLAVREGFIRILGLSDGDDFDRIDVVTASARSRLGNPISDAEQDEAGTYTKQNKMIDTADTQARGAAGMGGRTHLTTNAWDPTENSYAQQIYDAREDDVFVFYRNPDEALRDDKGKPLKYSVKADRRRIHEYAYEGSWWVNLDSIEGFASSLMKRDPAQAERFFGNRLVEGVGKWVTAEEWDSKRFTIAGKPAQFEVQPRTTVAFGMDLSNNNDWTGIRLETADLYQWTPTYDVGGDLRPTVWNPALFGGFIPRGEVRAAVDYLATRFRIVRAYVDPAGSAMGAVDESVVDDDSWRTELAEWAAKYGPKVFIPWSCARVTQTHASLEQLRSAIRNPESRFRHDGDIDTKAHITNAVMVAKTGQRYVLGKPRGADHLKIDQGMSSMLAHEATMDAIAGEQFKPETTEYAWLM